MRTGSPVVIKVITKQLVPLMLMFALYVQFHGDYGPGGGFQAGVIFAAGIVLYAMVFGIDAAQRVVPRTLLLRLAPLGVLLYAGTGVFALTQGGLFLDYDTIDPSDPSHGQHLGLLFIELGVGITVTSTMLLLFYTFAGRRPPR